MRGHELKAAESLATQLRQKDWNEEASALLNNAIGKFVEGFECPSLRRQLCRQRDALRSAHGQQEALIDFCPGRLDDFRPLPSLDLNEVIEHWTR